jgi:hypothetical protein
MNYQIYVNSQLLVECRYISDLWPYVEHEISLGRTVRIVDTVFGGEWIDPANIDSVLDGVCG